MMSKRLNKRRANSAVLKIVRAATIQNVFLLCALCASVVNASPDEDEGYLGIRVADNAAGQLVVSWFFPGPFDGAGLTSNAFDIARPDVIVAVDGESMNAERFDKYIRGLAPGAEVTIDYRVAKRRGTANIPAEVGTNDEVRSITVTVDQRDDFTGTIGQPRRKTEEFEFRGMPLFDPFNPRNTLGREIAAHGLEEPLKKLVDLFAQTQDGTSDVHSLSRVRAGFYAPFRLAELAAVMTEPPRRVGADPIGVVQELVADNLDVLWPPIFGGNPPLKILQKHGSIPSGVAEAVNMLSREHFRQSTGLGDLFDSRAFAEQCIEFLRVPRRSFYISGPDARSHIEVIRHSTTIELEGLMWAVGYVGRHIEVDAVEFDGLTPIETPRELVDAVRGPIYGALKSRELGWVVVGSHQANRYDTAKVRVIVDPGGNDVYEASDLRTGIQMVVDFEGDDHYSGTARQGPGAALLGLSVIDDRAGNDTYEGQMLSCGAAIYGVSLLLDRGGADTYSGTEWSMGAGVYGAGFLIDLGTENDTYLGEFLCQGVGGPRGLGALIDEGGRDLYRANGPHPSAYGTPAVYQSFSQGVGFGYRNYAAGGIGLLSDLGGDDRYEAGEFSQGGAYYYALGILHDASGRDLYYGNRYGQGFGVHQAHGVLADDAGDDTYWSMTAASQGAAWDIGAGLLIDRAGDDSYQADGLAQGGASMQAIAMLVDLGGTDRYIAGGGATQGQSGGDSYHYDATGAFSFSLLMDLGGAEDVYSRNRPNNTVTKTGELNEQNPANSSAWGLVIDR